MTSAVCAAALLGLLSGLVPATAVAGSRPDADAAEALAERYAPVVVVRTSTDLCDRDTEPYRPTAVETVLGRTEIPLRGGDGEVIAPSPSGRDVAGGGPETWLDLPGNPRRPRCRYARDFRRLGARRADLVYAHLASDPGAPGEIALQYWLFWYFDDYVNTHEGDWELIQVVWDDAGSAAEALERPPSEVGYSQHSGGERADWVGGQLERDGTHPVVYVGAGSHANYLRPRVYLGRSAHEGFGCDRADAPSTRLRPRVHLLPSGPPDPEGPDAWLLFEGRWGEFQRPPYDAPPGPATKREWRAPIAWQSTLRDSSFAIPSGGTLGPAATGAFCATVRAGGRLYTSVTSPLVLGLIGLGLIAAGGVAGRSTRWSLVPSPPLARRRAAGEILREARRAYGRNRRLMLALGLLFLPVAILETLGQRLVLTTTPLGSLVGVAGDRSLVSAATALLVAGAGHLIAATIVVGGVAAALARADAVRAPSPREGYRLLRERLPALVGVVALQTVVVILLVLTVVGSVVAVVLLGRWAVAVQTCAAEGSHRGRRSRAAAP